MIQVVHVTAHLGGGVGKILSGLAIQSQKQHEFEHSIITLEQTENKQFAQECIEHNVRVHLAEECDVEGILSGADIVQIDWWHHPLVTRFMINYFARIATRLVVWSHISGCSYPNIPFNFITVADAFIFAAPVSLENPSWSEIERLEVKELANIVYSSGINLEGPIEKRKHQGFNIGYVGFLDYSKLHPEFVKYCESASEIPAISFIIVGDTRYGQKLIDDIKKSELISNKTLLTGYTLDVFKELANFDVFGYPLNPNHTGTAENALLEAMGAGIVPVVLNQCTEKYLVENLKTGLVVNNPYEYGQALRWLQENPQQREKLGRNASDYVLREFQIENTVRKMNVIYEKLLLKEKKTHFFEKVFGGTPYEWFSACYVGDERNIQGVAFAETKGSAKQYLKYYPHDERLREVVQYNESRNKTKL